MSFRRLGRREMPRSGLCATAVRCAASRFAKPRSSIARAACCPDRGKLPACQEVPEGETGCYFLRRAKRTQKHAARAVPVGGAALPVHAKRVCRLLRKHFWRRLNRLTRQKRADAIASALYVCILLHVTHDRIQSFTDKAKAYLNLRLRAASDFFLRFTLGFS